MKATLAMPVKTLHGAMSKQPGLVASVWRGLQTFRQWVKPANPQSVNQVLIRNILTQAAQGFQTISAENKASWAAWAAENPRYWQAQAYELPEIAAYVAINVYRLIDGVALSDTPPTDTPDFVGTDLDTFAYVSGTTTLSFVVTHTAAVVTNKMWVVKITRSLASAVRKPRDNDFVLVDGVTTDSIIDVTASPQTISVTTPRFADWVTLDNMAIKVIPLSPQYSPGVPYWEVGVITVT